MPSLLLLHTTTYLLEYHHYSKEQKKGQKRREGGKKKNHQEKSCYILIDIEMIHISITRKNKADILFDEMKTMQNPLTIVAAARKKKEKKNTYLERPPDYYTYSRVDRTERGTLVHN